MARSPARRIDGVNDAAKLRYLGAACDHGVLRGRDLPGAASGAGERPRPPPREAGQQPAQGARPAAAIARGAPRRAPQSSRTSRAPIWAAVVILSAPVRAVLAEAIEQFRLALEHQDEAVITRTREELGRLVEHLRG